MARIKDFARDISLDIKDTLDLIAKYGLGEKQIGGNIEDFEIAIFLNKYTNEHQFKGIESYFEGEATIGSKKKAEPKAEVKVEEKVQPKAEPKPEEKPQPKAEPKAEAKPQPKAEERYNQR